MIRKMKQLSICLAIICGIFLAYSATAYATLDCSSSLGQAILNECQEHTVDTDTDTHRDQRFGQIIEGKIPLWKAKKFDINSKTGWDHANGEGYTTVQVDLKLEEGILQTAWNKVTSIFKKGD